MKLSTIHGDLNIKRVVKTKNRRGLFLGFTQYNKGHDESNRIGADLMQGYAL